ncbi:MAG: nicotinamide-nucleotide adenylyltransferase [Candidatus Diapherotrites archaeon]|nr:nicotinamide-nucleotide adenylyltransferase [Candidatus Diapherotrites archaeon]
MRALIVGRFQPYHSGHHEAIKKILKEVEELIIVVGSSQNSFELDDPFTAGERIEMISLALKKENLFDKCFIIPIDDISQYGLWASKVISYTPEFDLVYTNNPIVKQLFEREGIEVKKMISHLKEIDSSKIRKMMTNGGKWKKLLSKPVIQYLEEMDCVKRMKAIIEKEKKE